MDLFCERQRRTRIRYLNDFRTSPPINSIHGVLCAKHILCFILVKPHVKPYEMSFLKLQVRKLRQRG